VVLRGFCGQSLADILTLDQLGAQEIFKQIIISLRGIVPLQGHCSGKVRRLQQMVEIEY